MEWQKTTFGELKAGEIYAFSDPATDDCDSLDFICWIRGKNDGLKPRDTVYRLVSPERGALEALARRTPIEIKAAFALLDNREKVVDWLNVIEGLNVSGELKGSHDEISDAVTAALALLEAEKEGTA